MSQAEATNDRPPRLTELAALAGCTAKTGAESLERLLARLAMGAAASPSGEGLIVGLAEPDDAAVFSPPMGRALVFTVDFFAPPVDDPYAYGAIAAANAMSDVYAMGGEVVLALNISAMPAGLDEETVAEIFRGGQDKVMEAGGVIAGGHTIMDEEPKYGLSVVGTVARDHVMRKGGAQPGDLLYLTKPLGSGVITTAGKFLEANAAHLDACIAAMATLNRDACRLARGSATAMTDVTGFGLLGHAHEMASAGGVQFHIESGRVPLMDGAMEYSYRGILNGGIFRNRSHLGEAVVMGEGVDPDLQHLLFDPQTSGGLLFTAPADAADALERRFTTSGHGLWRIGEVRDGAGIVVG